jgi:hypothetical protein
VYVTAIALRRTATTVECDNVRRNVSNQKINFLAFDPQVNYADLRLLWTAKLLPTLAGSACYVEAQRIPTAVNLGFLDRKNCYNQLDQLKRRYVTKARIKRAVPSLSTRRGRQCLHVSGGLRFR